MLLQPERLPGFAFAWLELISHRAFVPKLLLSKGQKVTEKKIVTYLMAICRDGHYFKDYLLNYLNF